MKAICKKIGKKAVLVELPEECKRLKGIAELTNANLATRKIAEHTVVIFDKDDQERLNCMIADEKFYGDILVMGCSGAWLKDVDLELYTNRSMLPGLWSKRRWKNEQAGQVSD